MTLATLRKGKIRLYDGAGTPYYLEIDHDQGDFNAPLGRPKPEEKLNLDRGLASADMVYTGGDDYKVYEPLSLSFTVKVGDATQLGYILDWMEEMNNGDSASPPQSTNTINSNTLTSTKQDTQNDGANNNPAFADGSKMCCNVEYKLDLSTDIVWHFNEVYFPIDQLTLAESEDAVTVACAGLIYGTITRDSSFTSGTSLEA